MTVMNIHDAMLKREIPVYSENATRNEVIHDIWNAAQNLTADVDKIVYERVDSATCTVMASIARAASGEIVLAGWHRIA